MVSQEDQLLAGGLLRVWAVPSEIWGLTLAREKGQTGSPEGKAWAPFQLAGARVFLAEAPKLSERLQRPPSRQQPLVLAKTEKDRPQATEGHEEGTQRPATRASWASQEERGGLGRIQGTGDQKGSSGHLPTGPPPPDKFCLAFL